MQYRDPVSGKKKRRTTKTNKKRIAERMAGEWEKKLQAGRSWKSGAMSWVEFRDRYETEHLEQLAETTLDKANSILDCFEGAISPQKLGDINERTLSQYQKFLRDDKGDAAATIESHLSYLRTALNWSHRQKLIDAVPSIPKTYRVRQSSASTPMKGRPLTGEEYERMLLAVGQVICKLKRSKDSDDAEPDELRIPSWKYLLQGLWLSGLRLGEALELHWTDQTLFRVVLDDGRPKFAIPAESQKSNQCKLVPMTPDFAMFLMETPKRQRHGHVFDPLALLAVHGKGDKTVGRMKRNAVGKLIGRIGAKAKVIVDWKYPQGTKPKDRKTVEKQPVFASAHDLRRSFGSRWSQKVMPAVLQELMRHSDVKTTLRYYVGQNADRTADLLWEQYSKRESNGGETSKIAKTS